VVLASGDLEHTMANDPQQTAGSFACPKQTKFLHKMEIVPERRCFGGFKLPWGAQVEAQETKTKKVLTGGISKPPITRKQTAGEHGSLQKGNIRV